jgi:predicted transcriptional regulator
VSKSNGKPPVDKFPRKKKWGVLDAASVEEQLRKLDGSQAAVARFFGVTRQAVSKLVAAHPALQDACRDAREGMKDEAESSLYRAVKDGQAWAVCFFLKTQAKDRGYIERQEIEHQATNRLVIEEEVVTRDRRSQSEGSTSPESAGVPPV